jgi:hypothetical protein
MWMNPNRRGVQMVPAACRARSCVRSPIVGSATGSASCASSSRAQDGRYDERRTTKIFNLEDQVVEDPEGAARRVDGLDGSTISRDLAPRFGHQRATRSRARSADRAASAGDRLELLREEPEARLMQRPAAADEDRGFRRQNGKN